MRPLLILVLMLAGCASLEKPYWIKTWAPASEIHVFRVPSVLAYCPPQARACAKLIPSGSCNVYLPLEEDTLLKLDTDTERGFKRVDNFDHELCHCLGYDHPGWTSRGIAAPCPVDVRAAAALIRSN